MRQCPRCGTLNDDGALSCGACGRVLPPLEATSIAELPETAIDGETATVEPVQATVEPSSDGDPEEHHEAPPPPRRATPPTPKVNPYAELATLGGDEPAPYEAAAEAAAEVRLRRPAPAEAIPDWVLPPPLDAVPAAPVPPPDAGRRTLLFVPLLLAWLAAFYVVPGWTIWATSPELQRAQKSGALSDYFRALPTCEESAVQGGQPASVCANTAVRAAYNDAIHRVRIERHRVEAFVVATTAALAVAFLVALMAAGLSLWWWFAILVSPLSLIVQVWALWRLSAYPVRYWEHRT